MAETPNTPPVSGAPSPTTGPSSGPSGRSVFIGMGVGALVIAVVLGLILSRVGTANTYGSTDWTVFHDPGGYFTIALPPGWTIDGGKQGTGSTGGPSGSFSFTTYAWVASDPDNGTNGPIVNIEYYPLPNAAARQVACQTYATPGASSPTPEREGSVWMLTTAAAQYQINYGFFTPDTLQTVAPTPIPAATATAGHDLAYQIVQTFKPTPATALSC